MQNILNFMAAVLLLTTSITAQTTIISVNTDKARYAPGDTAVISLSFSGSVNGKNLQVQWYHLDTVLQSAIMSLGEETSHSITWRTPAADFRGYLAVIRLYDGAARLDSASIGIDVSSTWNKFPRYGYLSSFPELTTASVETIIDNLNRHHINGLQFYDWHWKHHKPLKGTPGNVAPYWNDIANRTIYLSTLQKYFAAAKNRGMKTMAYNLLYGAYSDAANDGVSNEWRMYSDQNHQSPLFHQLPPSWASNIYLIDHSNPNWVRYINAEMKKVFQALPFDGWHVDQLGTNTAYTYSGQMINMGQAFETFLRTVKDSLQVPFVCNAVNQFPQSYIAKTDMDFLYSEVWSPNDKFSDLVSIIMDNNYFSDNKLASALAAYVNKGISGSSGYFNTNAVLFTDAVIFAAGGCHIELGEHMLGNEYFPNNNLNMRAELKSALIKYYDFLTAYENILRDSVSDIAIELSTPDVSSTTWPPQSGKVWLYPRLRKNRLVIHAINFMNASTMNWRDDGNVQTEPTLMENITVSVPIKKPVKKIWYASPDNALISPIEIPYINNAAGIEMQIPKLKYWSVVVLEFPEDLTDVTDRRPKELSYSLEQNFPNPFNPATTIRFRITKPGMISLRLYDLLGREVKTLKEGEVNAGVHEITVNGNSLASGIYFYKLQTKEGAAARKLLLIK